MPEQSKNPFNFWQELKRRKVFRVIAIYAGAAYVIIELVNNIAEPLHLPEWIPTLVILLLIIGFPVVTILSWIFDLTPEGWKKTEAIEATTEVIFKSDKRKLRISDGIIAVLVVTVIILAYPRVFRSRASLRTMTMPVTVVNELGEKESRRVFRKDFVTRLAIFPFMNEASDSTCDWLKFGIYDAVWEDLQQFNYISIEWNNDAFHLQEQLEYARTHNCSHFLTGGFRIRNGKYEIKSKLYQSYNGAITAERMYSGSDIFSLLDSICIQARIDLGISNNLLISSPDLPIKEFLTDNQDAFRHFIKAYYIDKDLSGLNMFRANELDSTFAHALLFRALDNFNNQISQETALKVIKQAMRHRHRMSEHRQIRILILYHSILGNSARAVDLAETYHELNPYSSRILIELMTFAFAPNSMNHKFEKAAEKLNRLVPNFPEYEHHLSHGYFRTGKFDKSLKVTEKLLKDNPRDTEALIRKGEIFLHTDDLNAAENVFHQAILFSPEDEKYWSKAIDHIKYIRYNSINTNDLEHFTGFYRDEGFEWASLIYIHNNHLVLKPITRGDYFLYPVSEDQFTNKYGSQTTTFIKNKQGKVISMMEKYREVPNRYLLWKEDSLILNAKNLLNMDNMSEALSAFRQAYEKNPEHYYLANFIQHLEFIQSPEYDKSLPVLESYSGKYGDRTIYRENGQFYSMNSGGLIYKLLPLSDERFMLPSFYDRQIQIKKPDGSVIGINIIYIDGKEEFLKKQVE
jgi:tetratricopeptide (TPR) repeat protein